MALTSPTTPARHARPLQALARQLDALVGQWYNSSMKTAISLPDKLFESSDALARRLGLSRSQLVATALAEFLAKHRGRDVTRRLDAVYADESSTLDPGTARLQARSLRRDGW
jgi:antitoxin MazE6